MKRTLSITALLVSIAATQAAISPITVSVGAAIPDGDATGLASQVNVSGIVGGVANLAVNLNISGTYNGDLYAFLSHGSDLVVLLNRPGVSPTDSQGYSDHGLNVTFQDGSPNIHNYRTTLGNPAGILSPLTGTWGPDGRAVNPFLVDGTETPTTTLSSLISGDVNGPWTLFVADVNGGDLHTLNSWALEFTAVPEADRFGLCAALVSLAALAWRRNAKSQTTN